MKFTRFLCIIILTAIILSNCSNKKETLTETEENRVSVEMVTSKGKITIELFNETPLHRDNFIKLVNDGAYDSLLFHRVIKGFVVQGGDPDSRHASAGDTLGNGGLDYMVPAEFDTALFHKRGVIGAARNANPDRASDAMQFYIVQAGPVADSTIDRNEVRINEWLAQHYNLHAPENKIWLNSIRQALETNDRETLINVFDTLKVLLQDFDDFERYAIPDSHRDVYRTLGGTPQLDMNYTVFGEVVQGMEVVDSIAAMETNQLDRPLDDIRIITVRILNDKE